VGPLGHPRPWLFRESRSCVVELVARQSTGWVCLSFPFRVSSWIVLAAHRREMYLVWGGGGGPLDIVLSGSGRLVHGPLDGRCKAKNWNTLIPLVPVLRFRACPSVWSVLHTVGQRSLHLFTNYDGSPGPLSSSLFCSLVGVRTPTKGEGVDWTSQTLAGISPASDPQFLFTPDDRVRWIVTSYDRVGWATAVSSQYLLMG